MAKVRASGLRGYVGRLGGSVYYMNRGQNVARELAPEVSNPRTASQQRQRMRLANMVATYRTNRPWMGRKSFENKPRTWSDYNNFVSINSQRVPVFLTKEEAALGASVPAPYQFTKGTLPEIGVEYNTQSATFVTAILTDLPDGALSGVTIGEISDDLLKNNPQFQQGDQLSFIMTAWPTTMGASVPQMRAYELILDVNDTRELTEIGDGSIIDSIESIDGRIVVQMGSYYNLFDNPAAATFIATLSRTISGKTYVSDSHAVLGQEAQNLFARYNTQAALDAAAASYGLTEEVFLDAGYQGDTSYSGGGSGTSNRITSIDFTASIDGEGGPQTILPNGRNTMRGSSGDYEPLPDTEVVVHLSHAVEAGSNYVFQFASADGDVTTLANNARANQNIVTCNVAKANADAVRFKAGTYSLYAGTASLDTLIGQMAVTA